ncbi:hypothetical protein [Hymenobacter sp. BT190]|nr:hypothetical protein [Hymenobacter sp. BT190]
MMLLTFSREVLWVISNNRVCVPSRTALPYRADACANNYALQKA